jgi:hypothetical protein
MMNHNDMESIDFHYRDAIRLLYIFTGLAEPISGEIKTGEPTHVFFGEKRLMALDFYIRYPDYLANQLLDRYESSGDETLLSLADNILKGDEPDVRTVLMVRWKRGAYQKIETALSILEAPGLIKTVKDMDKQGHPWTYLIYPQAYEVTKDATTQQSSLGWYEKQVAALKQLPYQKSGTGLKQEQYSVPEYESAALGSVIPTIKSQVIERLEKLKDD